MTVHQLTWWESLVIGLAVVGMFFLMAVGSAFLLWLADRLDGSAPSHGQETWIYDQARQRYLPRVEDP